jgi:hypothetical protein
MALNIQFTSLEHTHPNGRQLAGLFESAIRNRPEGRLNEAIGFQWTEVIRPPIGQHVMALRWFPLIPSRFFLFDDGWNMIGHSRLLLAQPFLNVAEALASNEPLRWFIRIRQI